MLRLISYVVIKWVGVPSLFVHFFLCQKETNQRKGHKLNQLSIELCANFKKLLSEIQNAVVAIYFID
jgi:hypothetical protein